jgi:hypothetical protein
VDLGSEKQERNDSPIGVNASNHYRVGLGMLFLANGRMASLISNSFRVERGTAEYPKATRPMTAIGLVNGSVFREPTRRRWTLIVVNALRHYRVGCGRLESNRVGSNFTLQSHGSTFVNRVFVSSSAMARFSALSQRAASSPPHRRKRRSATSCTSHQG